MGRMKEYAAEVQALTEQFRRVSKAHNTPIDAIFRDIEQSVCEDENFTIEKFLGNYTTHTPDKQPRVTIPSGVAIPESWDVYLTQWNELRYCPVVRSRHKKISPVQVAS